MSKMVLTSGTEIKIEDGASLSAIVVVSESKTAMVEVWDSFTSENLKEVQIQNDDGTVVGEFADLVLVSETSTEQSDGTVQTTFKLRQKTEMELLKEEIAAIKETQVVQDGAITDIALAVSDIAGGE